MNSHAAIRGAPRARTRTWATIRIKSVDMLYLGAYTGVGVISDGHYFGWALLRMGVITGFYGTAGAIFFSYVHIVDY